MRKLCGFITASALLLIVNGCGGGGGGDDTIDNTPPPPPPLDAVQNGVFKDSNVSGLIFLSGQESGITDANGRFTCETGTDVVFSIGNVGVGQAECTTLIMPPSLVASGAIDDPETINIARFLQMLDEDGSPTDGLPTDGIEIASDVQTLAELWDQVNFKTSDLGIELNPILSDVEMLTTSTATLPAAPDAQQHLEDSLACAYAGAFAGSFSGTNSGAMEILVGGGGFQVFEPRGADWFAWDSKAEQGFAGGGNQVVELSARPTIISGLNAAGPINSKYITPDRITGTWVGGSFDVSRLGGDVGEYRFIGHFTGGVSEGIVSGGVIALHQAGNVVTGEAFETTEGIRFQVTGSVSVSGDTITMTATGGGETVNATATITRDADMEPTGATGTWPEGTINLVSCRLN